MTMNILQAEDLVKGLPDQVLLQKAQNPDNDIPQYLYVSEVQRRADMRKRYQQQQAQQPEGTIKDKILQEGIAALGGAPQMPQQATNPPQMPQQATPGMPPQGGPQMPPGMPPQMPPGMPPQGMFRGGTVRMLTGGQLPAVVPLPVDDGKGGYGIGYFKTAGFADIEEVADAAASKRIWPERVEPGRDTIKYDPNKGIHSDLGMQSVYSEPETPGGVADLPVPNKLSNPDYLASKGITPGTADYGPGAGSAPKTMPMIPSSVDEFGVDDQTGSAGGDKGSIWDMFDLGGIGLSVKDTLTTPGGEAARKVSGAVGSWIDQFGNDPEAAKRQAEIILRAGGGSPESERAAYDYLDKRGYFGASSTGTIDRGNTGTIDRSVVPPGVSPETVPPKAAENGIRDIFPEDDPAIEAMVQEIFGPKGNDSEKVSQLSDAEGAAVQGTALSRLMKYVGMKGERPPDMSDLIEQQKKQNYGNALVMLGAGVAGGDLSAGLAGAGRAAMLGQREINELESRQRLLDYASRKEDMSRDIDVLGKVASIEDAGRRLDAQLTRSLMSNNRYMTTEQGRADRAALKAIMDGAGGDDARNMDPQAWARDIISAVPPEMAQRMGLGMWYENMKVVAGMAEDENAPKPPPGYKMERTPDGGYRAVPK